jgi:hypothetical protein
MRKAGSCEPVTELDGLTKEGELRHCHHLTNDYVPRIAKLSIPFHSIPFSAFSYSNSNFLTKCTHTNQYLYCSLNVITQHTTTHRTQERHIHRTGSLIRIIQLTPTVGTEKEYILPQHCEVIYEVACHSLPTSVDTLQTGDFNNNKK